MKRLIYLTTAAVLATFTLALGQQKQLVFIAGPNDHCKTNPCHQYMEDLQLLKKCLEASDKFDIRVKLYINERPAIGSLDIVDAVLIHSSADRLVNEWHALFPPAAKPEMYDKKYMDESHNTPPPPS